MGSGGEQRHRHGGDHLPDDWNAQYAGTPPWDIGRPQLPFVELAGAGSVRGSVLEVGCGTGDVTLLAAAMGLDATGIDIAPAAIEKARGKAQRRGLQPRFLVQDALTVDALGETFDVVLDCGFFHVLSDPQRRTFADVLRRVTRPGSEYFMLCFSDQVPGDAGPRRIRKDEIQATFADGFSVEGIHQSYIEATFLTEPVPAWLARIMRLPDGV